VRARRPGQVSARGLGAGASPEPRHADMVLTGGTGRDHPAASNRAGGMGQVVGRLRRAWLCRRDPQPSHAAATASIQRRAGRGSGHQGSGRRHGVATTVILKESIQSASERGGHMAEKRDEVPGRQPPDRTPSL
jgi:hypothetical protein